MSTLTPSEARSSLGWQDTAAAAPHGQRLPQADLIPRSVRHDSHQASSVLDTPGYSNLNIDIPLDTQSSLSMELTHDAHDGDRNRASSTSTVRQLGSDAEPVQAAPTAPLTDSSSTFQAHEDSLSPRKPIPPQWKAPPRGPNLMTAIRGDRKRPGQGSSPTEVKSLRGTRSLNFLTKDAGETVEREVASSSGPSSPTKLHRSSSKASLKSPTSSPVRSSPRQQSTIKITLSPTRASRLGVTSSQHVRAPSSIISTGDTEFYSSRNSPVSLIARQEQDATQSAEGSEWSFVTAEETHEYIPLLNLTDADSDEQGARGPDTLHHASHSRGKSEPQVKLPAITTKATLARLATPKLSLQIPHGSSLPTDRKSPLVLNSASTSGSGTPLSPARSSRIPRVTTGTETQSHGPAVTSSISGSTLKRTQSMKSFASNNRQVGQATAKGSDSMKRSTLLRNATGEGLQDSKTEPHNIPLPETPVVSSIRHVRTVDSSGATPIISRGSPGQAIGNPPAQQPKEDCPPVCLTSTSKLAAQDLPDKHAMVASYLENVELHADSEHTPFAGDTAFSHGKDSLSTNFTETIAKMLSTSASRVTSGSTIKAATENPVLKDSAVEDPASTDSAIIYSRKKSDTSGTTNSEKAPDSTPITSVENVSPVEQYGPQHRGQAHSEHSLHSSLASDLRATAPEFVPAASNRSTLPAEWTQPAQNDHHPYGPFGIDAYGMPWIYHMYPIRMGRPYARSPKKGKPYRTRKRGNTVNTSPKKEEQPVADAATETEAPVRESTPFALQLEEIARQAAARREKPPRSSAGSGFHTAPAGPRGARPFRNVGNGLYDSRGRGRGVPMDATTPFPDPIPPPAGPREYIGYTVGAPEQSTEGCGVVNMDRSMEWGGAMCNKCEPNP